MRTAICVSNFDPMFKNRIQARVFGVHTEKVNGQYLILDDDLPWFSPAPSTGGNTGTYSVPQVGARVYVDGSGYKWNYYGQVETKASVKQLMLDNAEQCEEMKVIAFSEDYNDGESDYMKIYYLPEEGLNITCNGHKITLTKYDGLKIESKEGSVIELKNNNDINISTTGVINIKDSREIKLGNDASEKLILGSRLMEIFNNHHHMATTNGGITTDPPIEKIQMGDFSNLVYYE
jgi:hypothetical protein